MMKDQGTPKTLNIAFASGKGGAGKTSLSMSFHKYLAGESVFVDCDVDAADAFLLLENDKIKSEKFTSGFKYQIQTDYCKQCGECERVCEFGAIKQNERGYYIDGHSCEGCGACMDVCRFRVIKAAPNECGDLYISNTKHGSKMVYARLIPGEDNSGKLVHLARVRTKELNESEKKKYVIIDCPPGIGCPLIASISAVDYLVVIIESSKSGFSDAKRLIELAKLMDIAVLAVINKSGIDQKIDEEIKKYLRDYNIELCGLVPFDKAIVDHLNSKRLIIDSGSNKVSTNIKEVYANITKKLKKE